MTAVTWVQDDCDLWHAEAQSLDADLSLVVGFDLAGQWWFEVMHVQNVSIPQEQDWTETTVAHGECTGEADARFRALRAADRFDVARGVAWDEMQEYYRQEEYSEAALAALADEERDALAGM